MLAVYQSLRGVVATWSGHHPALALSHAAGFLDDESFISLVNGVAVHLGLYSEPGVLQSVILRLIRCTTCVPDVAARARAVSSIVQLACTCADAQAVVLSELAALGLERTIAIDAADRLLRAFLPVLQASVRLSDGRCSVGADDPCWWPGLMLTTLSTLSILATTDSSRLDVTSQASTSAACFHTWLQTLCTSLDDEKSLHSYLQSSIPSEETGCRVIVAVEQQAHVLHALALAASQLGYSIPCHMWLSLSRVLTRVARMLHAKAETGQSLLGRDSVGAGRGAAGGPSAVLRVSVELLLADTSKWDTEPGALSSSIALAFILPEVQDAHAYMGVRTGESGSGWAPADASAVRRHADAGYNHARQRLQSTVGRLATGPLCHLLVHAKGLAPDVAETAVGLVVARALKQEQCDPSASSAQACVCMLAMFVHALRPSASAGSGVGASTSVNACACAGFEYVLPTKAVARMFWNMPVDVSNAAMAAANTLSATDWKWLRIQLRAALMDALHATAKRAAGAGTAVTAVSMGEGAKGPIIAKTMLPFLCEFTLPLLASLLPLKHSVIVAERCGVWSHAALFIASGAGTGNIVSLAEGTSDKSLPGTAIRITTQCIAAAEGNDELIGQSNDDSVDGGVDGTRLTLCADGEAAASRAVLLELLSSHSQRHLRSVAARASAQQIHSNSGSVVGGGLMGLASLFPSRVQVGDGAIMHSSSERTYGVTTPVPIPVPIVSLRGLACAALLSGDPSACSTLSGGTGNGGPGPPLSPSPALYDFILQEGGLLPVLQVMAARAGFPSIPFPRPVLPDVGRFSGGVSLEGRTACWGVLASALSRAQEEEEAPRGPSSSLSATETSLHVSAPLVFQVIISLLQQSRPLSRRAPDRSGDGVAQVAQDHSKESESEGGEEAGEAHAAHVDVYADEAGHTLSLCLRLVGRACAVLNRQVQASTAALLPPESSPVWLAVTVLAQASDTHFASAPFVELCSDLCEVVRHAWNSAGGSARKRRVYKRKDKSGRDSQRNGSSSLYGHPTKRQRRERDSDSDSSGNGDSDDGRGSESGSVDDGERSEERERNEDEEEDDEPDSRSNRLRESMRACVTELSISLHDAAESVADLATRMHATGRHDEAASAAASSLPSPFSSESWSAMLSCVSAGVSSLGIQLRRQAEAMHALICHGSLRGIGRGRARGRGRGRGRPRLSAVRGRMAGRASTSSTDSPDDDETFMPAQRARGPGRPRGSRARGRGSPLSALPPRGRGSTAHHLARQVSPSMGRAGASGRRAPSASVARSRNRAIDTWLREPGPEGGNEGDTSRYADLEDFIEE